MGLGYALSTSVLFHSLIKVSIGGLRPHFLTVCAPKVPSSSHGLAFANIYYTSDQVCTGDESKIKEAQMSFPSGHTAEAFAGFGFLALWLNAKYKVLSNGHHFRDSYGAGPKKSSKGDVGAMVHHWKLVLVVTPLLAALLLSLSKIRDGWHHPADVVFGVVMGVLFAHLGYRLVYRSVYDWRVNHIPLGGDGGDREKSDGEEGRKAV